MKSFRSDFRFGFRRLVSSPGFTIVAVVTLALGIGFNTAIFSVIEAVMLRPLPYPHPERLLAFGENQGGEGESVSPANLPDYARNTTLEGIVHIGDVSMNLTGSGAPERIPGTRVTWNFFRVVGVNPELGRPLNPADDRFGAPHVVVLGNEFWRGRFGSDPHILGKIIRLDSEPYEVVGVMPAGFQSPEQFYDRDRLEYFVPTCFDAETLSDRGSHIDHAFARLRAGAGLEQARAEFDAISRRLSAAYPKTNAKQRVVLEPLNTRIVRDTRTALFVLLGAVFVILLIACVNVANLLLARCAGQRREIAVRIAIGARRSRIIRELLVQTGMLTLAGCTLGLLAATWISSLLIHLAPAGIPRLDTAGINLPVLAFTVLFCGGTMMLFGVAPAWLVSGADPQLALHGSGTRHSAGTALLRWRSILMAVEIALSLVLLIGAGLMLKSFTLLRGVNLGFQPDRVLAMNITRATRSKAPSHTDSFQTGPPKARAVDPEAINRLNFFETLVQRVNAIPGVESAAFGRFPLRGHWISSYEREEHPLADRDSSSGIDLDSQMASVDYFRTLQIPLIEGRAFLPTDRTGAEPVIIVNQSFARKFYPHSTAIGHRIRRTSAPVWRRIVGVVGDAHFYGQNEEIQPAAFLPAAQVDSYPLAISDFAVKSSLPLDTLLPAIRKAVWSLDPDQPLTRVRTFSESVSLSQATQRFQMTLLLLFGALALALAVVGIYGVVAYSVEQRTSEIGIRMALGARETNILGMVIHQAMILSAAGVFVGLIAAFGASRSLASLLFGVRPVDVGTYLTVALVLIAATLAAAYLPARRASHTDPMVALRHE